jgi:hypothetical protein
MLPFIYKSKTGDLIVIPAAVFFVLAVLFSVNKFTALLDTENGRPDSGFRLVWRSCPFRS